VSRGLGTADYAHPVSSEREWWRRTFAVVARPRAVFAALRNDAEDDLEARQEPVLAIVLLVGIAGVLATPVAGQLYDEPEVDAIFVAVWAFIAGGFYGFAGYFLIGGALYLGLRGLGSLGGYRRARHLLAFAAVPLIGSLLLLPVQLALYGGDIFGSGGADEGTGTTVFALLRLAFLLWAGVLLLIGIREVERWPWERAAGAIGLLALFVAAFLYLPSVF
jgi:hypothetical protein